MPKPEKQHEQKPRLLQLLLGPRLFCSNYLRPGERALPSSQDTWTMPYPTTTKLSRKTSSLHPKLRISSNSTHTSTSQRKSSSQTALLLCSFQFAQATRSTSSALRAAPLFSNSTQIKPPKNEKRGYRKRTLCIVSANYIQRKRYKWL